MARTLASPPTVPRTSNFFPVVVRQERTYLLAGTLGVRQLPTDQLLPPEIQVVKRV